MTRVIVDRNAGFCGGVRRAIRSTGKLLSDGPAPGRIVSYGQLVHNREVTDALAEQGLQSVANLEDVAEGDTVVIRTHGIPPEEERLLRCRPVEVSDFTCPRVKRVHQGIVAKRKEGYRIVIVGDPLHPEVKGLLGYAGDSAVVVCTAEEVRGYADRRKRKIAVFAQTTITPQLFTEVVQAFEHKGLEMAVSNTLCPFVVNRQRWIGRFSRLADASLIIGGKNSSNTRKLYTIASDNGPAYHLSEAAELSLEEILKYSLLALTAGASTADSTIQEVLAALKAAGAVIEHR
jgi:4-hydroxy-3-methylbut-2-enyl diphosphate reductase